MIITMIFVNGLVALTFLLLCGGVSAGNTGLIIFSMFTGYILRLLWDSFRDRPES